LYRADITSDTMNERPWWRGLDVEVRAAIDRWKPRRGESRAQALARLAQLVKQRLPGALVERTRGAAAHADLLVAWEAANARSQVAVLVEQDLQSDSDGERVLARLHRQRNVGSRVVVLTGDVDPKQARRLTTRFTPADPVLDEGVTFVDLSDRGAGWRRRLVAAAVLALALTIGSGCNAQRPLAAPPAAAAR
jgi:hypothetical protein